MLKSAVETRPLDASPLLNLQQTARRLGIGESTVRKLVRTGGLPAVKLGRRLLFEQDAIAEFIAAHRTRHAEPEPDRTLADSTAKEEARVQ